MAENSRKCLKCGRSPGVDPNTKLFRFPKPGITNTLKCELWAKYCFPNGEWSSQEFQQKLHREHRMLCHRHFKRTSFSDYPQNTTKLHRFAVPDEEILPISSKDCERDSFPSSSDILIDITNKQQEKLLPISSKDCERESAPSSSGILIDITNKQQEKLLPISSKDCERESAPSSSGILIDITNKQQEKVAAIQPLDLKLKNKTKTDTDKNVLYRKCRANLKKIYQLKKRIKSLKKTNMLQTIIKDKAVGKLMKHVTPAFALMLQAQLRNTKRKYKGRRWSLDDKIICLRMYKRSATCYRLLRRIWCLPAPSTLKNLLRKFNLQAGLNERIFNSLKKHMKTQEPLDQEYILMFDEMSIRKHLWYNPKEDRVDGYQDHGNHGRSPQEATHALVFMVSGIRKKTKQPVAFYLSSAYVTADRLAILIKEVLQKCFSINMNISATVCDMGGVNRRALNILGASTETPYFQFENNEVVTIFDPPHLLKCFRNLFLKYDIKCDASIISNDIKGQGIAKWKHVEDFYKVDNSHPNFVYAPKLRKEHINPNSKQKMRVYLAAQVLSYSVAGGIFARISDGLLTSEATITGDMIKKIDMLFDCLNSNSADHKKGKPHLTNFTEESPHLALFEEMKKFFENAEFIGCKSLPPSKQGWIWTLNAVARVYYNLKRKYKIKALATRHLQQDPLENLFGTIRANCGANCNPTAGQFIGGLKTAMLSNLAHMGSGSGNCKLDECESVLTNYKRMLYSTEHPKSPLNVSEMLSSIESIFDESVSEQTDTAELQACAYVCGFMLKNIKNNACTACNEILKTKNKDDLLYTFMHFKEYNDTKKSLKYASEELIQCVESCATHCNNLFSVSSYSLNLKENTLKVLLKNVNFSFLRTCEVHFPYNISFITNSVFHICIKRFCTVKNRNFVEAASAGLKRKIDTLKHI